jgi:hypothetical protein
MLSTGTNIDEIINNALQAAKEATERVITWIREEELLLEFFWEKLSIS